MENETKESRKSIVVGFDFSPVSGHALKNALSSWLKGPADLHLVHAVDDRDYAIIPAETPMQRQDYALDLIPDQVADALDELDIPASADGIQIYVHVRLEPPAKALIRAAADYQAECIVVGTHGRSGLERMLLGSVAEELVRRAPCPVRVERVVNYEGVERSTKPLPPVAIDPRWSRDRWTYKPVRTTRVDMDFRNVDVIGPGFG